MSYILFALQNTGEEYASTRHNAGSVALQKFALDHGIVFASDNMYQSFIAKTQMFGNAIVLALPKTYMNECGKALKKLMAISQDAQKLIVIHDDLDLPIGNIKVSYGRGSGGHNGIKSIINVLGTNDFIRIRIGISPVDENGILRKPQGEHDVSEFVIGNAKKYELDSYRNASQKIEEVLKKLIEKGITEVLATSN